MSYPGFILYHNINVLIANVVQNHYYRSIWQVDGTQKRTIAPNVSGPRSNGYDTPPISAVQVLISPISPYINLVCLLVPL